MSEFKLYPLQEAQWPEMFTGLIPQQSCVFFDNQQSYLLTGLEAPDSVTTASHSSPVSWPQAQQRLVLIGSTVSAELVDKLASLLKGTLKAVLAPQTGSDFVRVEILLNDTSMPDMAALQAVADEYQVDLNLIDGVIPSLGKPGLVVLDMDSTSITIECIDEIAKLAGAGDEVAAVTELAMQGKLDFSESLRARVGKLQGVELSLLDTIAHDLPLMPGMATLAKGFQDNGWRVAIASGGFTYFANQLQAMLGLDRAVSNTLAVDNGRLTGEVVGEIVDAAVKARTVVELAEEFGIEMAQTVAIGDGANDLMMMEKAALGIAFHAKPLVREKADTAFTHCHLAAVLSLLER